MLLSFETSSMVEIFDREEGQAKSYFDPLEWMITETHARGLNSTLG
jgi:uncharacterized lipoprotein YddW (UPF0748 family)